MSLGWWAVRENSQFRGSEVDGTYYGLGTSVQSYPVALQDALRPAIRDLAAKAKTRMGGQ